MSTAIEKDYPVSYKSRPLMTKDSEINKQKISINEIKSTTRVTTKMNGNVNNCNAHSNNNNGREGGGGSTSGAKNEEQNEMRQLNDTISTAAAIDNEVNNNSATITAKAAAAAASKNDDSDRENSENHQPSKCNGSVIIGDEDVTLAPIVPEQKTQQGRKQQQKATAAAAAAADDNDAVLENGDFSGVNGTISAQTQTGRNDDNEQHETKKDNKNTNSALDIRTQSKGYPPGPDHASKTTTTVTSTPVPNAEHIDGNGRINGLENGHDACPSSNTSENTASSSSNENVIGTNGDGNCNGTVHGANVIGWAESESALATNGNQQPSNANGRVTSRGHIVNQRAAFVNRNVLLPEPKDRFQFYVPQDIVGRLIGKGGANVNEIHVRTRATISVCDEPTSIASKLCLITGSREEIAAAIQLIRSRFKRGFNTLFRNSLIHEYIECLPYDPNYSLRVCKSTINRLRIRSVVNSSHFFFENPYHPMGACLEQLNESMHQHYSYESLDLTKVINGIVCVAFLQGRWYRSVIVSQADKGYFNIKLLDYGNYYAVPPIHLKQIHQSHMVLPFQAIEAIMHNIKPPFNLQTWNLDTQKEHQHLVNRCVDIIYRATTPNHIDTVDMYIPVGDRFTMFWNESLVINHKADWIVPPSSSNDQ